MDQTSNDERKEWMARVSEKGRKSLLTNLNELLTKCKTSNQKPR